MNRRETIKHLGKGSLLITVGGFSFYRCSDVNYLPQFFDQEQYNFLSVFANCVLPSCEESPGATEAGVASFLDQYIPVCKPKIQQQKFKETLQSLLVLYQESGGLSLLKESDAKKNTWIALFEEKKLVGYDSLKSMILFAFFTSEEGMTKALRYVPVPGGYRGDIPLHENDNGWAI
jgi:hypothetical protein